MVTGARDFDNNLSSSARLVSHFFFISDCPPGSDYLPTGIHSFILLHKCYYSLDPFNLVKFKYRSLTFLNDSYIFFDITLVFVFNISKFFCAPF